MPSNHHSDITLILHCGQIILYWLILKLIESNGPKWLQNILFVCLDSV
jgi:hypothetical protein